MQKKQEGAKTFSDTNGPIKKFIEKQQREGRGEQWQVSVNTETSLLESLLITDSRYLQDIWSKGVRE